MDDDGYDLYLRTRLKNIGEVDSALGPSHTDDDKWDVHDGPPSYEVH